MRPQTAPGRSPEYQLIRLVKVADTAGEYVKKGNGCNFGVDSYKGLFRVVPINTDSPVENLVQNDILTGATSNPALTVRYWDDAFGRFILHAPTVTIAAQGVGVAYEFELDVYGRIVMIEVTGGMTAGQGVLIFAAGFSHQEAF